MTDEAALDHELLDNVAWHALTTVQSRFAEVCGGARRYHPDVSVFAAIDTGTADDWADLAKLVGPDGVAALFRAQVPAVPSEWTVLVEGVGHQMVFDPSLRTRLDDVAPVDLARSPSPTNRRWRRSSRWPSPGRGARAPSSWATTSARSTATGSSPWRASASTSRAAPR
ncbi:MAG: hypothetical protein U0W40_12645 [Acidimicrobiia bacterium]